MAGGSASSREQNFWPGFVDALTNVVLVMVFVVVVFAISMFGSMLKISKAKVAQGIAQQVEQQQAQVEALTSEVRAQAQSDHEKAKHLQEENRQLTADLSAAQQALSLVKLAEGGAGVPVREAAPKSPVVISGRAPALDVSYALGVTTLEKKLMDALDGALGNFGTAGQWQVSLQATMAEPSPSEARRLAFYRLAVLRDHLVSKGVAPSHIETLILNAPSTDGRSHVAIRLRKQP